MKRITRSELRRLIVEQVTDEPEFTGSQDQPQFVGKMLKDTIASYITDNAASIAANFPRGTRKIVEFALKNRADQIAGCIAGQ